MHSQGDGHPSDHGGGAGWSIRSYEASGRLHRAGQVAISALGPGSCAGRCGATWGWPGGGHCPSKVLAKAANKLAKQDPCHWRRVIDSRSRGRSRPLAGAVAIEGRLGHRRKLSRLVAACAGVANAHCSCARLASGELRAKAVWWGCAAAELRGRSCPLPLWRCRPAKRKNLRQPQLQRNRIASCPSCREAIRPPT